MFTPVGFSCYFSQASAVPRQLYFQRIEEQWNPTSQKEAFVSTSDSGSNVALGREMESDCSAITTTLLKFSPVVTGQNWSLILLCLGGTHSPINLPLRASSRNSESTQAPLPDGLENSFVYRKPGGGIRRYLHFFRFPRS